MKIQKNIYSNRTIENVIFTTVLIPINSSFLKSFGKFSVVVLIASEELKPYLVSYSQYFYEYGLNLVIVDKSEYKTFGFIKTKSIIKEEFKISKEVKLFSQGMSLSGAEKIHLLEVKDRDLDDREKIMGALFLRNNERIKKVNCGNIITVGELSSKIVISGSNILQNLNIDSNSLDKLFNLVSVGYITKKDFLIELEEYEELIDLEFLKLLLRGIVSSEVLSSNFDEEREFDVMIYECLDKMTLKDINEYFYNKDVREPIVKTQFMIKVETMCLSNGCFPVRYFSDYLADVSETTNNIKEFYNYIGSLFKARVCGGNSILIKSILIEYLRITRQYSKRFDRMSDKTKHEKIENFEYFRSPNDFFSS